MRTGMWVIEVAIPQLAVSAEERERLFDAVCDAVNQWEPKDRDGWDTAIYTTVRDVLS